MVEFGARAESLSQAQREGFTSSGRAVLALFFSCAMLSHPALSSCLIFGGYIVYVLLLRGMQCGEYVDRKRLSAVARLIDVVAFGSLLFLAEGVSALSAVFFTFLLLCCSLRMQITFYALAAILTAAFVLPFSGGVQFFLDAKSLLVGSACVAFGAALVYLRGAREYSFWKVVTLLAEWPHPAAESVDSLCAVILPHAAAILGTPRIAVLLQSEGERSVQIASFSGEASDYCRLNGKDLQELICVPAEVDTFFCRNAADPSAPVVIRGAGGGATCSPPLASEVCEYLGTGAVAASRLAGKRFAGFMLALDRKQMTGEDLLVCEIVASQVADSLGNHLTEKLLQEEATLLERTRLACDLHDGLLQTIASAVFDLERVHGLVEKDPRRAKLIIKEIQHRAAMDQKDLRSQVTLLRQRENLGGFDLRHRLAEVVDYIGREWNIPVEIDVPGAVPVEANGVAREIYLMAHEALMNAVRHADPSSLHVKIEFDGEQAYLKVSDNGRGFPFLGSYDEVALARLDLGPRSLRDRISALGGHLLLHSEDTGAVLEMTIPTVARSESSVLKHSRSCLKPRVGGDNVHLFSAGR